MTQRAIATGVKFWPGSPSKLGEKVASGLVLRFGTLDCISDNLACFENGFDDSGSFLDVGGHRFYVAVAKPFLEEVTDMSDPLRDTGSSCSENSNLGAMIEVLALGVEEGCDILRSARPPLECLLPQEQAAPLPEQDNSDITAMDLHAPLDHAIDLVQAAEALERTCIALLDKEADIKGTRRRVSSTYSTPCRVLRWLEKPAACDATMAPCYGSKQASGAVGISVKSRPSGALPKQLCSK
jgi:hypothetical protein